MHGAALFRGHADGGVELVRFFLGFGALGGTVFVDGVIHGLNQALYTAIFGAGLGYARLAQKRRQRWAPLTEPPLNRIY